MRALCFLPLFCLLLFLFHIVPSSTTLFDVAKNNLFKKKEGLQNIFLFFGTQMDHKMYKCRMEGFTPEKGYTLKYKRENRTIYKNLTHKTKRTSNSKISPINYAELEYDIAMTLGKNPTMIGFDNLFVSYSKKDGNTHLSRTGIVKSENGYFILRRSVVLGFRERQFFNIQQISGDDPYVFWENDRHFTLSTFGSLIGVNAEKGKYYLLWLTNQSAFANAFRQEGFLHYEQFLSKVETKIDGSLNAKEIFEIDGPIFSNEDDLNMMTKHFLNVFDFFRNALVHKQTQDLLEKQFLEFKKRHWKRLHKNQFFEKEFGLNEQEQYFATKPYYDQNFMMEPQYRKESQDSSSGDLNFSPIHSIFDPQQSMISENDSQQIVNDKHDKDQMQDINLEAFFHEDEHSDTTTQDGEHSVLKRSLSFIFEGEETFDELNTSDENFEKLLENSMEENFDSNANSMMKEETLLNLQQIWDMTNKKSFKHLTI